MINVRLILERRYYNELGSWCKAEERVNNIIRELESQGRNVEEGLIELI